MQRKKHGRTKQLFQADYSAERFCLFVGYGRSGHSLVGALLDAHPDMVIAHELDALALVKSGIDRDQLLHRIVRRARWFAKRGCVRGDYSYEVPGQWQGKYRNLRVIGDKKGGGSSQHLIEDPELLKKTIDLIQLPTVIFHVVRNPFDNITTIARHRKLDLEAATERYFGQVGVLEKLLSEEHDWGTIHNSFHEDLTDNPKEYLRTLCAEVDIEADDDYLDACARIVRRSASKTRTKASWTPKLIQNVNKRMSTVSFLKHYTFED